MALSLQLGGKPGPEEFITRHHCGLTRFTIRCAPTQDFKPSSRVTTGKIGVKNDPSKRSTFNFQRSTFYVLLSMIRIDRTFCT